MAGQNGKPQQNGISGALEDAETEAFLSSKKMVPPGGKSECNGEATPVLGTDALDGSPVKDSPLHTNCGKDSDEKKVQNNRKLLFGVEETPDVYWSVLLAFQQALTGMGTSMHVPILISYQICAEDDISLQARLMAATIFMSGISTILMTSIGVRLPILQGPNNLFIVAVVSMMAFRVCPSEVTSGHLNTTSLNGDHSNASYAATTAIPLHVDGWQARINEVSGCLIMASFVQVFLGSAGFVGHMMRFVGPLTVVPTVGLTAISMTTPIINISKPNWAMAFATGVVVFILAVYMEKIMIPCPAYNTQKGFHIIRLPVFKMLPIIIGIAIVWSVAAILTVTNVLPPGRKDRTDYKLYALHNANWLNVPYPGMFGMPTFSVGGFVAMLAATLLSVIDSVADYHATAIVSRVPSPPDHALNRGIAVEGIACVLSGAIGTGHGTTSYGSGIAAIAITKVASRRVFFIAGIMLTIFGLVNKFGAFINMVPSPILGGIGFVNMGMFLAVALGYLQFLDLKSTRNLMILGVSMFVPMCVSQYVISNTEAISTGYRQLDEIVIVVLSSSMLLGGIFGCFLDNTVPGTIEERGIKRWREQGLNSEDGPTGDTYSPALYDLPYVTEVFDKVKFLRHVPCCPSYQRSNISCKSCFCCRKRKFSLQDMEEGV